MKHHQLAEKFYRYDCPGKHAIVFVQNNNPTRGACYTILERAGCLIHDELSRLPDSEKSMLPNDFVPPVFTISLLSEMDSAAVNWRGLRTRRDRAFPLRIPLCPTRPGSACIWRSIGGSVWDVVVCSDLAAREARKRSIPYREELVRYAIHGLLHLAGDSDDDADSAERLFRRQEALVETALRRRPCRGGRMDNH